MGAQGWYRGPGEPSGCLQPIAGFKVDPVKRGEIDVLEIVIGVLGQVSIMHNRP